MASAIPTEALVFSDSYFNLIRMMTVIPDRSLRPLFSYQSGVMDVTAGYDTLFQDEQLKPTAKNKMESFVHDCVSFNCDTLTSLLGQAISEDVQLDHGSRFSITPATSQTLRALMRNRNDETLNNCLLTTRLNACQKTNGYDARADILAFIDYTERSIIGSRFGHYTKVSMPISMIMLYLACGFYDVNLSDMRNYWAVTPVSDRVVSITDTTLACIPFSTPMVLACSDQAGPCRTSRPAMELLHNLDRIAAMSTHISYPRTYCDCTTL